MQEYVMLVSVDESLFDGDESIEAAARIINGMIELGSDGAETPPTVRPLSEVVAC